MSNSNKDMYADLKRIEDRGKKKKRGFGSWFGKKDEEQKEKEEAESFIDLKPEKHTPASIDNIEVWKPLEGMGKEQAVNKLKLFKIKLNKIYKDGKKTKEECRKIVVEREIQLGLRPPE